MKKAWIAVISVIIIVLAVVGYFYYTKQLQPPAKRILKVGTSPDFPPFEFINETTNEIV